MHKSSSTKTERPPSPLKQLLAEILEFARECANAALCLEREVRNGECVRQSPESKHARAEVLRAHEKWALDLFKLTTTKKKAAIVPQPEDHHAHR